LAWFQGQPARIVLAVAAGEPIQAIATRLECDRVTVWRVCRRYEQGGLKELLLDEPRIGRPQEISPPPARPNRRTGRMNPSRWMRCRTRSMSGVTFWAKTGITP
jgi:hypothetical protein